MLAASHAHGVQSSHVRKSCIICNIIQKSPQHAAATKGVLDCPLCS